MLTIANGVKRMIGMHMRELVYGSLNIHHFVGVFHLLIALMLNDRRSMVLTLVLFSGTHLTASRLYIPYRTVLW